MLRYSILFISIILLAFSCKQAYQSKSTDSETMVSSIATGDDAKGRLTIKTASISAKVDNINDAIKVLNQKAIALEGKLEKISITENSIDHNIVRYSKDSNRVIEKKIPEASLKLSVPKKYTDTFINYVLQSGYTIRNFDYENKDFFVEVNSSTQEKQVNSNTYYENDLAYQSKYLWFDITLTGKPLVTQTIELADAEMHNPFALSLMVSLERGMYAIQEIVVALFTIWPFWIIVGLIFYIVKKNKKRIIPQV